MGSQKHALLWSSHSFLIGIFIVILVSIPSFGLTHANITVLPDKKQSFSGFGAGCINRYNYQQLPGQTRKELSHLIWKTLGFRFGRLLSELGPNSAAYFANRYQQYIKDVEQVQPDIQWLLTPAAWTLEKENGFVLSLEEYASQYAEQIKTLKDSFDIEIDVTGVVNEPNEPKFNFESGAIARLVKLFRQELDARGLQHVKIIGPETSNVDNVAKKMFWEITDDTTAYTALHAFATHSYNMCMTHSLRDMVKFIHLEKMYPIIQKNNEYWQTEAGEGGAEDSCDDKKATYAAARFLGDINLGVSHWFWFLAYDIFDASDNTTRIISFSLDDHSYWKYLKFYYFYQLSRTFEPGTEMRTAQTDLTWLQDSLRNGMQAIVDNDTTIADSLKDSVVNVQENLLNGKNRFSHMENTYGMKPPVCAAAGINPDGTWGIGVTNYTGIPQAWHGSATMSADTFEVTIDIEELHDSGDIEFLLCRSDKTRQLSIDTTCIMQKGKVTFTIAPLTLVTLRPFYSLDSALSTETVRAKSGPNGWFLNATTPTGSARNTIVSFTVPLVPGSSVAPVNLSLYSLKGKKIETLLNRKMKPGPHRIAVTPNARPAFSSGVYLVRLKSRGDILLQRVVLVR